MAMVVWDEITDGSMITRYVLLRDFCSHCVLMRWSLPLNRMVTLGCDPSTEFDVMVYISCTYGVQSTEAGSPLPRPEARTIVYRCRKHMVRLQYSHRS